MIPIPALRFPHCEECPFPATGDNVACKPTPAELQALPSGSLGAVAIATCALNRADEAAKHAQYRGDLLERVSVDNRFGILTFNSQKLLFEWMVDTGKLAEMRERGYAFEMVMFDINLLKLHNTLGDHYGGDVAIGGVIDVLKRRVFRREDDVLAGAPPYGVLSHIEEATHALRSGSEFAQFSRYEGGDELFGVSFSPPLQPRSQGDRRRPVVDLDERRDAIVSALEGLEVEYPLTPARSLADIKSTFDFDCTPDNMREDGEGFMIRVPVSATFGIARSPVPTSIAELDGLARTIDNVMMRVKEARQEVRTEGVVIAF